MTPARQTDPDGKLHVYHVGTNAPLFSEAKEIFCVGFDRRTPVPSNAEAPR